MSHGTILIANDDAELAAGLATRCWQFGLTVATTNDASDVPRLIEHLRPDVVCLDVDLPGGSGLTICGALAADPRPAPLPVIILTGSSDPDIIRRCHESCASYVLKGTDVWPQLEPLLRELLCINFADQAAGPSAPYDGAPVMLHSISI